MNKCIDRSQGGHKQPVQENNHADENENIKVLTEALCSWYVRRDNKFYKVDRLHTKLSRNDVESASLRRIADEYQHVKVTPAGMKEVFRRAIEQKHTVLNQSIPIWNGAIVCQPTSPGRLIWEDGMVAVNSWIEPEYRSLTEVEPSYGIAEELFSTMFPREAERRKLLDWLAWCLQNEGDKPAWAPFLYSDTKGSGKSTLCQLILMLFGERNTLTQNNVDKLTSRFNATVLTSKLVISEEVNLRADSSQGNALKTFITEKDVTIERKGHEAEVAKQIACFVLTSNHLPLWIEENDRRFYLLDIDHDGHASGPKAEEFSQLVGRVKDEMQRPAFLRGLHLALLQRELSAEFSAKTLNVAKDATELMRRVHGASELTTVQMMREHLQEKGQFAVPGQDIVRIVVEELKGNPNVDKHLMTKLGWSKQTCKWGSVDHSRAIWVAKGFWIEKGMLRGPDGFEQRVAEHLGDLEKAFLPEIEKKQEIYDYIY